MKFDIRTINIIVTKLLAWLLISSLNNFDIFEVYNSIDIILRLSKYKYYFFFIEVFFCQVFLARF